MTRRSLTWRLSWIYVILVLLLLIALAGKAGELAADAIGDKARIEAIAKAVYEFVKDMSVVIVTIAAVYLASLLQRRANFVESLEEEWRRIVETKAAIVAYCDIEAPTRGDYNDTFRRLSITLDTMRIAYKNVGETDEFVGLYPFAPLHNMRRALTTIEPKDGRVITAKEREAVRITVGASFAALRENFLEELDLEEPVTPVLHSASRRLKRPGYSARARSMLDAQGRRLKKLPPLSPDLQALQNDLDEMRAREDAGGTPPRARETNASPSPR